MGVELPYSELLQIYINTIWTEWSIIFMAMEAEYFDNSYIMAEYTLSVTINKSFSHNKYNLSNWIEAPKWVLLEFARSFTNTVWENRKIFNIILDFFMKFFQCSTDGFSV